MDQFQNPSSDVIQAAFRSQGFGQITGGIATPTEITIAERLASALRDSMNTSSALRHALSCLGAPPPPQAGAAPKDSADSISGRVLMVEDLARLNVSLAEELARRLSL